MADQNEQQTGQPVFRMQKMYIKDLSFESPHAPQVFQASQKHEPTIKLDLKLKHEVVAEDNYEVSMTVTAKMVDKSNNDTVLMVVELEHAAVFLLRGTSKIGRASCRERV